MLTLPSPFLSSLATVSSCLSSEKEEISWLYSLSPQLTKFSFFCPHGEAEMLLQTTKWRSVPDTCAVSASISQQPSNSTPLPQDSRYSTPCCHTDHFPCVALKSQLCSSTLLPNHRDGYSLWEGRKYWAIFLGFLCVLYSELNAGMKRNSSLSTQAIYPPPAIGDLV